jgi:hypothetical protein
VRPVHDVLLCQRRHRQRAALGARWPATATAESPAAPKWSSSHLRARLVDEFALAISQVRFGGGRRLFAVISPEVGVELVGPSCRRA